MKTLFSLILVTLLFSAPAKALEDSDKLLICQLVFQKYLPEGEKTPSENDCLNMDIKNISGAGSSELSHHNKIRYSLLHSWEHHKLQCEISLDEKTSTTASKYRENREITILKCEVTTLR